MTEEEINGAIAEIRGFVFRGQWQSSKGDKKFTFWDYPEDWLGPDLRPWAPNFCGDLNAMHEAERMLPPNLWTAMENNLYPADDGHPLHFSARERAVAFLRTLGKWKD